MGKIGTEKPKIEYRLSTLKCKTVNLPCLSNQTLVLNRKEFFFHYILKLSDLNSSDQFFQFKCYTVRDKDLSLQ